MGFSGGKSHSAPLFIHLLTRRPQTAIPSLLNLPVVFGALLITAASLASCIAAYMLLRRRMSTLAHRVWCSIGRRANRDESVELALVEAQWGRGSVRGRGIECLSGLGFGGGLRSRDVRVCICMLFSVAVDIMS